MNEFRALLLDIAQDLRTNDLEHLKFACSSFIPAGRAEFIARPHELFLEMERMGRLSENDRTFLANTFIQIGRKDLRNKLLGIQEGPLYDERQLQAHHEPAAPNIQIQPYNQNVSPEIILEIAEKVSTSWKFLGRYLKVGDHTLSSIEDTYRRTEEKSYEMLKKWRETSRSPTILALLQALNRCGRRDLAELVQSKVDSGGRATENVDVNEQRPFPGMRDMLANLPQERPQDDDPQAHRQNNRQPREDEFTDRPSAQPVMEDGARQPIQTTDNDDLKKPGSYMDKNAYTITDCLGRGGFSHVYCVLEKATERVFAVKTVELGENDSTTQEKVDALEREIKLLKVLVNPYVVKYYRTEVHSHLLTLFMEYMPGGSIAKKLSEVQSLDEEIVRKYTWQLLKGLEYLHENKIIHRDIKGANVLLDASEEHVKLSDFGISVSMAGIATSTGNCLSNQHGLFASVFWTSPELLCSEPYSFNTDIWSLGCTVVEMLTGDPPFRKNNQAMVQLMYKISTCCVEPPEECSDLAKDFLKRCFLKQSQRPSAKDLLERSVTEFPEPQEE